MEQASGFLSNETLNFCNCEGIELIKTPVKDHCATGMVERTIGSMKIFVLTYLREHDSQKLKKMIARALCALPFVPHSKLKKNCLRHIMEKRLTPYSEISRKNHHRIPTEIGNHDGIPSRHTDGSRTAETQNAEETNVHQDRGARETENRYKQRRVQRRRRQESTSGNNERSEVDE